MPSLKIQPGALRALGMPPWRSLSTAVPPNHAAITSTGRQSGRSLPKTLQFDRRYSIVPPQKEDSNPAEEKKQGSYEVISSTLQNADPSKNNLLSAIHVPEDPSGVLNEKHPAFSILANSSIVMTRQLEMMNIMLGFEQANKYVIMDGQGNHIGFLAEKDLGMGSMFKRQMLSTHRSFETHVFDKFGKEVLRFHRPFAWISSRIGVYDPTSPSDTQSSSSTAISPIEPSGSSTDISQSAVHTSSLPLPEMRIIGEAQQQWAPLRRKYNLFLHRDAPDPDAPQLTAGDLPLSNSTALQPSSADAPQSGGQFGQFAYVDEPFLSWDFSLLTSDGKLLGSVNRNFAGFGREIFTDTGVYALRMDAAGLAQEPGHLISKSGKEAEQETLGMTLDQRAVMLATAVSVDFDYFSRKSRGGVGGGLWPLWLPGGGGGAAAEEAGAETGAMEGASESAGVPRVPGQPETAAGGAAGLAGYELYEQGRGQEQGAVDPNAPPMQEGGQPGDQGYVDGWQQPQAGQGAPGEETWGQGSDPWGGSSGGNGGSGGGGGGGDGGGSWLSDLLE